jgi:putative endonuclease
MPTPLAHNQKIGNWGEEIAAQFLREHGYEIIAQNVHTRHGEIDLVAKLDQLIIFVEVKARTSNRFGDPENAITPRKQERIAYAIDRYLNDHPDLGERWRFDAITVVGKPGTTPIITHFEHVF